VLLYHVSGATDGYESNKDSIYSTRESPVVDFFSQIAGHNLAIDKRGLDSTSTYDLRMQSNGVTSFPLMGALSFNMSDPVSDFRGLEVFADVYRDGALDKANIDVRDWAQNETLRPLALESPTDFYTLNVRFVTPEPGTLGLFATAGICGAGVAACSALRARIRPAACRTERANA
jgi:hypothetical protein